jgi:uncharacterized protein (TIGR01244 family)
LLNRFRSVETRLARRSARIARWGRPIDGVSHRLQAWASMILADHGVFRLAYLNRHKVSSKLWRSAQPAPHQIAWFAAQGVRTVINLRGGREHGAWPLQKEACERHGIRMIDFVVRSRDAPTRETLMEARDLFDSLQYPVLVHCKSGADRAGFFAALYLLHEGRPASEAIEQLSLRYGHFRFAKTGILDAVLERYRIEGEAKGMPFFEWAERDYDREAVARDFKTRFWSDFLVDRVMHRE